MSRARDDPIGGELFNRRRYQVPRETGKAAFAAFMHRMSSCCREKLPGITVMVAPGGTRAAAEITVLGEYLDR